MSAFRTESGGRVDRSRKLRFSFDGDEFEGLAGDTLASALLANGVHLAGRSFKYHRPRGIVTAGAEEPNALVAVRRDAARYTPNLRATQVELYEGSSAESQNRWPSLGFDLGRAERLAVAALSRGVLLQDLHVAARRLGRGLRTDDPRRGGTRPRARRCPIPTATRIATRTATSSSWAADPPALPRRWQRPTAARAWFSATSKRSSAVRCWARRGARIDGLDAGDWLARSAGGARRHPRVRLLPRTTAFGYFPHNAIGLNERLTDHLADPPAGQARERLWQLRAREVVLATGAIEQPLVFPGNDRPGIMLAGAAQTYLRRYGVRTGSRAVVVTSNDSAYQAALELRAAGVEIAAIADLRERADGVLPQAARSAGIEVIESAVVLGTRGGLRVSRHRTAAGEPLDCDLVLMSGGFTPSVHLFSQSRGALKWDEAANAFLPASKAERDALGRLLPWRHGPRRGACRTAPQRARPRPRPAASTGAIAPLRGNGRRQPRPSRSPPHRRISRDARREGLRGLPERCHGQ